MHRVGYVLSEGFQMLALGTQAVFECANLVTDAPFYALDNFSESGGGVRTSLGLSVDTRPLVRSSQADTWILAGVNDPVASPAPPGVLRFLRRRGLLARRVA